MSNPFRRSPSHVTPDSHQPQDPLSQIETSFSPANALSHPYEHPSTKTSLDQPKAGSQTRLTLLEENPHDLEAARPTPAVLVTEQLEQYRAANEHPSELPTASRQHSRQHSREEKRDVKVGVKLVQSSTSVWPTRAELEREAKLAKRERLRKNWHLFSGLPRKQRIAIQVLLFLVVVGAAVGIGFGISLAVGGTTYKSDGQTEPLPGDN